MVGFTLLELLVTMTLIGLVVVLISGALRVGIGAWERGTRKVSAIQNVRVALDLMKGQITSAMPVRVEKEGKEIQIFKGDSKHLAFVSSVALTPGPSSGAVYARYAIEENGDGMERLVFLEADWAAVSPLMPAVPETMNGRRSLIQSARSIRFEFLSPLEDINPVWTDRWNEADPLKMPSAVRITITPEGEPLPVDLVVRIPAEATKKKES